MLAVLSGKLAARREDCAPVAGKSTLNRLELSRLEPTRYHKISHNPVAIKRLFVDLFLEAHERAPNEIILDLDATDDPVHGEQEGRFFHGYYDCYCYLPLYVFCGRHLLAAKLRRANIDAAAGAVEEVARIVAQIRRRWPLVRILLRADSGFAREELMAWCEANGVHFLFGLAKTDRLIAEIKAELREGCGAEPTYRQADAAVQGLQLDDAEQLEPPAPGRGEGGMDKRRGQSSLRRHLAHARRVQGPLSLRKGLPAATWRTGSRNASLIFMPIAPRPPPCGQTSCAPVRTVVWEGRSREAPPYPDQLAITEHVDARRAVLVTHVSRVRCRYVRRGSLHGRDGSSCSGQFEKN